MKLAFGSANRGMRRGAVERASPAGCLATGCAAMVAAYETPGFTRSYLLAAKSFRARPGFAGPRTRAALPAGAGSEAHSVGCECAAAHSRRRRAHSSGIFPCSPGMRPDPSPGISPRPSPAPSSGIGPVAGAPGGAADSGLGSSPRSSSLLASLAFGLSGTAPAATFRTPGFGSPTSSTRMLLDPDAGRLRAAAAAATRTIGSALCAAFRTICSDFPSRTSSQGCRLSTQSSGHRSSRGSRGVAARRLRASGLLVVGLLRSSAARTSFIVTAIVDPLEIDRERARQHRCHL